MAGLSKSEILRGYGRFRLVMSQGARIDGRLLSCFCLSGHSGQGGIKVGFTVPARKYNSVQRNRLKRIMRAGFVEARPILQGARCELVLFYKGSPELHVNRVRLVHIVDDIALLLTAAKTKCR